MLNNEAAKVVVSVTVKVMKRVRVIVRTMAGVAINKGKGNVNVVW